MTDNKTPMSKFVEARNAFFNVLGYELTEEWRKELKHYEDNVIGVEQRLKHLVEEGMIVKLKE
jgi:hypothetical protein